MRQIKTFLVALTLLVSAIAPLSSGVVFADDLAGESFGGISTPAHSWISGGSGGSVACLTAASISAANSIPRCSSENEDTAPNGYLRLTPAQNARSGFAIYNTPVSAADGLSIKFDMYQWGGSNADGISFFLIDGAANPTQPGAAGGSLGYASADETPGLVGGYVGVGFDRFGNYSNPLVGGGGPGAAANSIGVRGSEDSGYQWITKTPANASLSGTNRTNSKRSVMINISTNNVMSVAVDYGSGYESELSGIDLNDINGEGALPANFKFGFAASTGGSTNNHEIRGLTVATNAPSVGVGTTNGGNFVQGGSSYFDLSVGNDSAAEPTNGLISVTQTLPSGIVPTSATGTGWTCDVSGQTVTCTRPGSGGSVLNPGTSAPTIRVNVNIASDATLGSKVASATVTTPDNDSLLSTDTDTVTVLAGSYSDNDGIFNAIEAAAPNTGDGNDDGTSDSTQSKVTSLPNPVVGTYAVLQTSGCSSANNGVSMIAESSNATADGSYTYPVGLMDFQVTCSTPGGTATIVQYYYGNYDTADMVVRKFNATDGTYTTINDAVISNVTLGSQAALKIQYDITDGGPLDDDALANGTIVDPAGPAVLNAAINAPTTTSGGSGATAPDTGLQGQPMPLYYSTAMVGLGLITYAAVTLRKTKKLRSAFLST